MSLSDDLERIGVVAAGFAAPGEQLVGILAAEPLDAGRVYLCAYQSAESLVWLAFDDAGRTLADRRAVRDAASLAALCELAEENAGGGDVPQLVARLTELRETEAPAGIEEAEGAAHALLATIEPEPRLATTAYLDRLGAAARRLEAALGEDGPSPFAAAMQQAVAAADGLADTIERAYKGPLA